MQFNERNNQDEQKNHKSLKRLCPLVKDPHEEIHRFNMDSGKIRLAIYYCQGNFEECDIYKRIIED